MHLPYYYPELLEIENTKYLYTINCHDNFILNNYFH